MVSYFLILALEMVRADKNDNADKPFCQHIYFALLPLSLKSQKVYMQNLGWLRSNSWPSMNQESLFDLQLLRTEFRSVLEQNTDPFEWSALKP